MTPLVTRNSDTAVVPSLKRCYAAKNGKDDDGVGAAATAAAAGDADSK